MAGYGWTAYDTRRGGTQTIPDVGNKINITTEFVKISEGSSRGNWGLRVRGTPREGANGLKTVVVFYVAMEAMEKCQGCGLMAEEGKISPRDNRAERKVVFWSKSPDLGGVNELHLVMPKHEMAAVKSVNMTEDVLWKSKCKCFRLRIFMDFHLCFLASRLVLLSVHSLCFVWMLTFGFEEAIFVDLLKDEAQSKQGNLVIANEPGVGNAHFAQMVFKDQFEVSAKTLFDASSHS